MKLEGCLLKFIAFYVFWEETTAVHDINQRNFTNKNAESRWICKSFWDYPPKLHLLLIICCQPKWPWFMLKIKRRSIKFGSIWHIQMFISASLSPAPWLLSLWSPHRPQQKCSQPIWQMSGTLCTGVVCINIRMTQGDIMKLFVPS